MLRHLDFAGNADIFDADAGCWPLEAG